MQVKIRKALSFPTFDFSKELKEIAEKIFIPELAGRIQAGVDIDNNKYPSLASNTVRQKEKKKTRFHPEAPLIDSGELFSSFRSKEKAKNRRIIYIDEGRAKIGVILQNEGVKSKKYGRRHFFFFGTSKTMEKNAVEYMLNVIKREIRNGKRRTETVSS